MESLQYYDSGNLREASLTEIVTIMVEWRMAERNKREPRITGGGSVYTRLLITAVDPNCTSSEPFGQKGSGFKRLSRSSGFPQTTLF